MLARERNRGFITNDFGTHHRRLNPSYELREHPIRGCPSDRIGARLRMQIDCVGGAKPDAFRNGGSLSRDEPLPALLLTLRWRWKLTLLVALSTLLGAAVYVHSLPSEYDGKAIVAFSPRANVATATSDTVRVVVPKYVAYLKSPYTVRAVAAKLGEKSSVLSGALNASLARDTGTIAITARMRSPVEAARVANAFADRLLAFAKEDRLLSAQLVAPALPPSSPSAPPRLLLDAAALMVGLLLGVGLSVLLERSRPRLRAWGEMAELTGYPVLGRIPRSRAVRAKLIASFSNPIVGASFRTLRANLEPILRDQNIKVIIVTSPSSSDGKTTVSALLAESLSRLGKKTLLVDADLRRPCIGELLPQTRKSGALGLAALLRNGDYGTVAIGRGWIENLYLLPTMSDEDAGDLLARKFGGFVTEIKKIFDFIVVDTPPLLGTDDTRVIASSGEEQGVLLVVSTGSVAQPVNEAILAIESVKAPMLGIVGNRLRESGKAYSYYT